MGTRSKPVIIAVEGRSGTGKTHLSLELAEWFQAQGCSVDVLHLDELYPGWHGLHTGLETYTQQLLPALARDGHVTWTPWNWYTSRHDAPRTLGPADVIIIEGVGAGHPAARRFLAGTLTLTLDTATRKNRALARDGATYAPHWDTWAAQEEQLPTASDGPNDITLSVDNGSGDVFARARIWVEALTAQL
ncbi:hypothetical protein QP228_003120 [Pseudoglutamicibacter cumminsii]|uniref:hypothetical protein n=1 Tax=Pseudoglutamicibacter cumminsii TaxID=156979 RepID=UPI002554FEDB|nr:hypothetical protein [Pseudoglutamicibacter cumminsii]MDZ3745005.1 hypothetical protein [Pseudoglutamicibacter cumminsii]